MIKKVLVHIRPLLSKLLYWSLILNVTVWLGTRFGLRKYIAEEILNRISTISEVIFLGVFTGVIILTRSSLQPMNQQEAQAWETKRVKGKRQYILDDITRMFKVLLYMILVLLVIELLAHLLGGEPFSIKAILFMIGLLMIFFIGVPILVADKDWSINEKDYKTYIGSHPQHNTSLDRRPRSES